MARQMVKVFLINGVDDIPVLGFLSLQFACLPDCFPDISSGIPRGCRGSSTSSSKDIPWTSRQFSNRRLEHIQLYAEVHCGNAYATGML